MSDRSGDPPPRQLMLVSATASDGLRREASAGRRPTPEYLVLERDHDVELLDWSRVVLQPTQRSPAGAVRQVGTALLHGRGVAAFLSDGEHLGLPLAQVLAMRRRRPGHVVIAHHLTTPSKLRILGMPGVASAVDHFVVHSLAQRDALLEAGLPDRRVKLVPYGVDTQFWEAQPEAVEEPLILSPGREHRDHATLAAAVGDLDVSVVVTDGSAHSPAATRRLPESWPGNIQRGPVTIEALRGLYGRAAVVVVPLLATDFPAGITVVLEAMAMGKAVVVSDTPGLRGALLDDRAVVRVPPDDPLALRSALATLLADDDQRREIGLRAAAAVRAGHGVGDLARGLHDLLDQAGAAHA